MRYSRLVTAARPQRAVFPCRFCPLPDPQIEPQAGQWKTWVLSSGSQFRLPAPADGLAQEVEIRNLITRAYALMSVAAHDGLIACWDGKYTYWAAHP